MKDPTLREFATKSRRHPKGKKRAVEGVGRRSLRGVDRKRWRGTSRSHWSCTTYAHYVYVCVCTRIRTHTRCISISDRSRFSSFWLGIAGDDSMSVLIAASINNAAVIGKVDCYQGNERVEPTLSYVNSFRTGNLVCLGKWRRNEKWMGRRDRIFHPQIVLKLLRFLLTYFSVSILQVFSIDVIYPQNLQVDSSKNIKNFHQKFWLGRQERATLAVVLLGGFNGRMRSFSSNVLIVSLSGESEDERGLTIIKINFATILPGRRNCRFSLPCVTR